MTVRPLTHLTRTTVILLAGLVVVAAWRAWADWFLVRTADTYDVDAGFVAEDMREAPGWAYVATLAATAAVFFCWIWRARANADLLSRAEHRLARGWVIAGWLVPVLNAVMPRALLEDIWRTSRPDTSPELLDARDLPHSRLIAMWWVTWGAILILAILERGAALQPMTMHTLRRTADWNMMLAVAHGLSAVLLVIVVVRVSRWQSVARG